MKCCVAKSCCSNWRVSGWASPPNHSLTRDMRLNGRSSYKHTMLWTHAHCSERNKPSSIWFRAQWFEILKFIHEKHMWNYFYRWKKAKLRSAFTLQNQIKETVQVATKIYLNFQGKSLFEHRPHFHPHKNFIFCNEI